MAKGHKIFQCTVLCTYTVQWTNKKIGNEIQKIQNTSNFLKDSQTRGLQFILHRKIPHPTSQGIKFTSLYCI